MKSENMDQIKLYIFYCSNSSSSAELDGLGHEGEGVEYKFIGLPCSGKANVLYFLKAFETGADGLVIITCSKSECRYLEGNLRTPRRAEAIDLLLEEAGMGQGRIAVLQRNGNGNENEPNRMIFQVEEFRDKIKAMSSPSSLEAQPAPSTFHSLPTSGSLHP